MTQLQEKLLTLLKEIDEICQKHGIEYFLYAGTLLGAVRNNGFLPWDDDADIIMTRDNWNKFKKYAPSELKTGRKIELLENNEGYPYTMPHYIDETSTCIYKPRYWGLAYEGIYIDMFIVDPIPKDLEEQKQYKKKLYEYIEFVDAHVLNNREFDYEAFNKNIEDSKTFGRRYVLDKYEKELFNIPIEECNEVIFRYNKLAVYLEHTPLTYIWNKKFFTDGPEYVPFEDTYLPIFKKSSSFLRQCYGDDWMILPENCVATHDNSLRSMDIPFYLYFDSYKDKINKNLIDENYIKIKSIVGEKNKLQKEMTTKKRTLNAIRKKIKLNRLFKQLPIQELLKSNEFDKLNDVFSSYISLQCDKLLRIHGVIIDIDDIYKYACMFSLIMRGEYYIADKIFGVYKRNYNEFSDLMLEIKTLLEFTRDLAIKNENEEYDQVNVIVDKYIDKYPYHVDLIIAKAKNMIRKNENIDSIINYLNESMKVHPNNTYLKKLLADMKLKSQERQQAVDLYYDVLDKSRNGLLLLEVNEILESIGEERKDYGC